jgi:hypothetical protein
MIEGLRLASDFTILASQPAATPEQLLTLANYFGSVPSEYTSLVGTATDLELQHCGGQYLRIWGPMGCIDMDEGYGIRLRIPDAVPIGDDGGGRVIFYTQGSRGYGLYHVGYGNLDRGDAVWIAPHLNEFLMTANGIETF